MKEHIPTLAGVANYLFGEVCTAYIAGDFVLEAHFRNGLDLAQKTLTQSARNWAIQFGLDFQMPEWLDAMVDKKFAEDSSWSSDVSPSITFLEKVEDGKQVVIFVDHANKLFRGTPYRFSFFYKDENDDLSDIFYCQNDGEAREFLKKKLSKKYF